MKQHAIEVFRRFSFLPGSEHIASEYAILGVLRLIRSRRPHAVLEVGLGIGTIAYAVMSYKWIEDSGWHLTYHGTEGNEYCITQLHSNLADLTAASLRFKRFVDILHLPDESTYDMIIVDGKDPHLSQVIERLSSNGVIFVEGARLDQIETLIRGAGRRCVACRHITLRNNRDYGPFAGGYMGGYTVIVFEPTIADRFASVICKNIMRSKSLMRRIGAMAS